MLLSMLCFTACHNTENKSDNPVVSISVAPQSSLSQGVSTPRLALGVQVQYQATVYYRDGSHQVMTDGPQWRSTNDVASVNSSGVVTAHKQGLVEIEATLGNIVGVSPELTITDAVVTAIQLTPATISLAKGYSQSLTATATYSDQTSADISSAVSWNSANTAIATVTPSGVLTGAGVGGTTVTASLNGISSNTASVTVTDAVLTAIQITPATVSLAKGYSQPLTAMATYSDQTSADISTLVAWTSANTAIATVTPGGVLTGSGVGSTTVSASLNGINSNTAAVTVTDAVLTAIQLTPATPSLPKGMTQTLTATATYSDQTSADITGAVAWVSANTSIATVTPSGVLTGAGVGSTTVTASLNGINSNTAAVTVTDAVLTAIQVTPATISLAKGYSQTLTATAIYSDQTSADISSSVAWISANTSIATVTPSGVLMGAGVGSTTVTASLNGISSNTAAVTVTDAVLTSIQVTPATLSLAKGDSQSLTATATYSDQTSADISSAVSWNSANTAIATVTPSGVLTGAGVGGTTVTASLNGISSNTASVTVTDAVLTAIQVTPVTVSLAKGYSQTLTATAIYSDQTSADISSSVAWTSANTSIATVTPSGVLTGAGVGSTTVTASLNGINSNTAAVTVTDAVLTAIQVTPAIVSMAKGYSQSLTATATYSDQTSADISSAVAWRSANTFIATVTPSGVLTGAGVGSTTVTASLNGISSNSVDVTITDAVMTSIQLTPATPSLPKGASQALTATAIYSDGTSADISGAVNWVAADTTIATVTRSGLLTGVGVGSTTVTASVNGISSNLASVTVSDAVVTAIQLTPATVSLAKGYSQSLTATATYSDQTSADISAQVAWSSADMAIATVTPSGLLAGVDVGSTTVSATFNGISSNTADITITDAVVTAIQVTPASVSFGRGVSEALTAMASYSDGTQANITASASWISADATKATVTASGVVTGVVIGSTSVTVTFAGVTSSSVPVTVTAAGTVVTWGDSTSGGDSSAVQEQLTQVTRIVGTDYAAAALKADGSVVTWGDGYYGGDSSAVRETLTQVTSIVGNGYAFAALKADGSVVAWGDWFYGGDTRWAPLTQIPVTRIVSTHYAFAALQADGSVVAWGDRDAGGNTGPVEGLLRNVRSIASTHKAFAVLRADGSVETWGHKDYGGEDSAPLQELGQVQSIASTGYAFAALNTDGTVVTWGDSTKGGNSGALTQVASITGSEGAFAALKTDGSVVTWGDAAYGGNSSAVQSQLTQVTRIVSTHKAFAALKTDGSVVTWGDSISGGNSNAVRGDLTQVVSIVGNGYAFAALRADGSVVTWGDSTSGGNSNAVQTQLVHVQSIAGFGRVFAAVIGPP